MVHVTASVICGRARIGGLLLFVGVGCSSPPNVKTTDTNQVAPRAYGFHGRTFVRITAADPRSEESTVTVLEFLEFCQRETWLRFEYDPSTREMLSKARMPLFRKCTDLTVERILAFCHALLRLNDCMLVLMLNRPKDPPTWWVVDYRRAGIKGWKHVGP
jgi:hypothetical protein